MMDSLTILTPRILAASAIAVSGGRLNVMIIAATLAQKYSLRSLTISCGRMFNVGPCDWANCSSQNSRFDKIVAYAGYADSDCLHATINIPLNDVLDDLQR